MKIDYDTLEWHDHTRIKLSFTGNISDNCWLSCFVRFYSLCSFWLKEAITLSSGNCGRLPLGVQPMLPKFWFQLRIHEQIDMSLTHEINMNLHEQWGLPTTKTYPHSWWELEFHNIAGTRDVIYSPVHSDLLCLGLW